jgi:hypothetical protein
MKPDISGIKNREYLKDKIRHQEGQGKPDGTETEWDISVSWLS